MNGGKQSGWATTCATLASAALVLAFAATGCAAEEGEDVGASSAEITAAPSFKEKAQYVDWTNSSGTFRIYKTCLGPDPSKPGYIGHDGTVGPGYVATVWDATNKIVSDDTAVLSYLGPNSGATGIGQFGFHLARVPQNGQPFTAGTDKDLRVFQVSGRFCNSNRRPSDYGGYNGYGVRSFSKPGSADYVAPKVDANGLGHFAMSVVLGDEHSDLVRVGYTYVVEPHDVKVWIRTTILCSEGKCDSAAAKGDAFVKEPKIIVGVNPAQPDAVGYHLMTAFDDKGGIAQAPLHDNKWTNACGSSRNYPATAKICEYGGQNPVSKTGQCDDAQRRKVRFWNGTSCPDDASCLVVAAGGADRELGPSVAWEGAAHGLDAWAVANVTENRERAAAADSNGGGVTSACYNSSSSGSNRRWELAGYAKTPACAYKLAVASFHAWEGGTGIFDCENLYYRFGKSPAATPESYVTALSIGFRSAKAP